MCSGDLSGFRCLFTSGRGSNLVQRVFSFWDSREVFQCFFYYFSFICVFQLFFFFLFLTFLSSPYKVCCQMCFLQVSLPPSSFHWFDVFYLAPVE